VHYEVRGRPKEVRYWLMAVDSVPDFSANDEVDRLRWLSPAEAMDLLSYERDREVLAAATEGA
jgi:8-oxo-dGTP diphosphatase